MKNGLASGTGDAPFVSKMLSVLRFHPALGDHPSRHRSIIIASTNFPNENVLNDEIMPPVSEFLANAGSILHQFRLVYRNIIGIRVVVSCSENFESESYSLARNP
jgi:hypothetical protein